MKMLGVVLVLCAILLTSCKAPKEEQLPPLREYTLNVRQFNVPSLGIIDGAHVIDLVSLPGESRDAFIIRTAQELWLFSQATNFEACGRFAVRDVHGEGQLAIRLWTNMAHKGCLITFGAPDGFVAVGEYIHSHPVNSPVIFNTNDELLSGGAFKRGDIVGILIHAFSPADYAAGPGYLVAGGKLLYQNGRTRSRVVAHL